MNRVQLVRLDPSIGAAIEKILRKAEAHYVMDSIADIESVIEAINQRLARGERP